MAADRDLELTEIFDVGFDRRRRRIYFGSTKVDKDDDPGAVCWKSVDDTIRAMHVLINDSNKKPIEIHVHSDGGDVYAMLRLIDELEACPCKTIFIGGGMIASAMTWIMAVCDERRLHKNSFVMLHDGEDGIEGSHTNVQVEARHAQDLHDRIDKIFADNTLMPLEFWQDILQRDLYITAEEAIKIGLADKIVEPKKRGNLRRSRIALMNQERDKKEMRDLVKSMYERTNRKNVRRLQLDIPREYYDPTVTVEEMEPLQKQEQENQEELHQYVRKSSSEENQ